MKMTGLLIGYLLAVFVGGGLLAPVVWWLGQGLAEAFPTTWMRQLTDHAFHRYTHRCILVLAIAGLVPVARALGCRSWRDVGWTGKSGFARHAYLGFIAGVAMYAVVTSMELVLGLREFREFRGWASLGRLAAMATLAAVVVGALEESLFRGVVCGGLRRHTGWSVAMAVSSVVYSLAHFLQRPRAPREVEWWSGLWMVGQMLDVRAASIELLVRGAVLLLAGYLLAWAYRRSGSLWLPFGLHAGWVLAIKLGAGITRSTPTDVAGVSSGAWISGMLAAGVAGIALVAIIRWKSPALGREDRIDSGRAEGGFSSL